MTLGLAPSTVLSRRSPRLLAVVGALVVALLAGCGLGGADDDGGTSSSTLSPSQLAAPQGFETYYTQTVTWKKCGDGFVCGTFRAPVSWQDASSGSISLAAKVHRATGTRIGSLLINPGGPGGSGIDLVDSAPSMLGKSVLDAYDVVGFDPRGVGQSTEVTCLDDAEKDRQLSTWYPETAVGLAAMEKDAKQWADACVKNTGDLLGHVDTQSVARDMDMMRAVLGQAKLDYLGYSYGTQIGSTYAALFPSHVGRMVLDGAIDPTLSSDETSVQQAVGFENALRDYVKDCETGSSCPLSGGVDAGMAQIKRLFDETKVRPLPTSDADRPLTATLAFYGVAVTLYSQSSWSYLTAALSQAIDKGDGTILLNLADQYNDRNSDGSFSTNSSEAFRAVGCLDDPGSSDLATMTKLADQVESEAPTVGSFFSYGGVGCKPWPYPQVKQEGDVHAKGAAPIVIVGTTNDPATPYAWAQGLAKALDSAVLVTYEGEGHTAYRRDNTCIADLVDDYLVDGKVPAEGSTCS
ncbi:alpha/beta hydrolase [Luteimicrobium subarcticum]|uniref:Alpha/beta hydrolase family protein n=1 Tax=Luteimicrobium subarcticum TaxID=620910 RepID=A0A2M8WSM2_9MICO|nr:alpha/beta hydrolase [Luteimicrobium subarcticum]PJI93908.1 alpha/beta hydrolase family protein [Luteimicrobium subarcticum]